MKNMELKIHNLSLAAEIRILKKLEKSRRLTDEQKSTVSFRRKNEVRPEARAAHLAYGFLRGRTMEQMELPLRPKNLGHVATINMTRTKPDWDAVYDYAYGNWEEWFDSLQDFEQRFEEFRQGGAEAAIVEVR